MTHVLGKERGKAMTHEHFIIDEDNHFVIDPDTRAIEPYVDSKNRLMQYDHNSERYTFEIPRYIEGHDMSLSDSIQIHYINTSDDRRESNSDVYEVTDKKLVTDSTGKEYLTFSWLISQNATQYNGNLIFAIRFKCIEDDDITYIWNTEIFSSILIGVTINSGVDVVERYSDVLEEWKKILFNEDDKEYTPSAENVSFNNEDTKISSENVQGAIVEIDEKISSIDSRSSEIESSFDDLEESFEELNKNVDSTKESIESIKINLNTLESSDDEIRESIDTINSKLESIGNSAFYGDEEPGSDLGNDGDLYSKVEYGISTTEYINNPDGTYFNGLSSGNVLKVTINNFYEAAGITMKGDWAHNAGYEFDVYLDPNEIGTSAENATVLVSWGINNPRVLVYYDNATSEIILFTNGSDGYLYELSVTYNTSITKIDSVKQKLKGNWIDIPLGTNTQQITSEAYNALTEDEKKNGDVYFVDTDDTKYDFVTNEYKTIIVRIEKETGKVLWFFNGYTVKNGTATGDPIPSNLIEYLLAPKASAKAVNAIQQDGGIGIFGDKLNICGYTSGFWGYSTGKFWCVLDPLGGEMQQDSKYYDPYEGSIESHEIYYMGNKYSESKNANDIIQLKQEILNKQEKLIAGNGISIIDGVISCTFENGNEVRY